MAEVDTAEAVIRQQAAAEDFNARCNAVEAAGQKTFGDKWFAAKQDLALLDDHGRIPMDILQVALETEDPARVLFELSKDLEKTDELMGMTPTKRAIAMDKIASSRPAERPQTKTPLRVEPLGGRGGHDDRPRDSDSDDEWNRKEAIREHLRMEERRKSMGR
jgi:hypothetical protein